MAQNDAVMRLADDIARARINDDVKLLARAILVQTVDEKDQLVLELSPDASPWYGTVHRDEYNDVEIRHPIRAGDTSQTSQPGIVQAVVQTSNDISFTMKRKASLDSPEHYLFLYRPDKHWLYFTNKSIEIAWFEMVGPPFEVIQCPQNGTVKLHPSTYWFRTHGLEVLLRSFPHARCSPLEQAYGLTDDTTVVAPDAADLETGSRKRRLHEQQAPSEKPGPVQRRRVDAQDDVASTITTAEWLVHFDKDQTIHVHGTPLDPGYTLTAVKKLDDTTQSNVLVVKHSRYPSELLVVKVGKWEGNKTPSRYKHERNIHKSLDHKQIVKFHHGDDRFFTIHTEYIQGPDLGHHAFADPNWMCIMPRDMVSCILETTCQGLEYLRTQGITHGDVKLANILFLPTRGALIADFGFSQWDDEKPSGAGSPMYLSYEHLHRERLGPYRDTFALGIVMLYLLGLIKKPDRPRFDDNGRRMPDPWRPKDLVQGNQASRDALTAWHAEIDIVIEPLLHIWLNNPIGWLRSHADKDTALAGLSRRAAPLSNNENLYVADMLQHVRRMFMKYPIDRIKPAEIARVVSGHNARPNRNRAEQWAKFIAGEKNGVAWEQKTLEEYLQ